MKEDWKIKQDVEEELEWTPGVVATDIGVEVANGIITLSGHPVSYAEKLAAEDAAGRVSGVRADLAAEDIGDAISRALKRHAEREAKHIDIKVEGATVTLTGKVGSASERDAARGAAWATRGVTAVVDNLEFI
ncbi:BON domain-containing protein [Caballeronia sp. BR00000012568055]|uniref:BON domain-containing protein n=1 Tax=Caballeronia sp. BR00000012568055 TaxID=2918761 RepID=UPI0023F6D198|nr:BON domain-containing protein [Caballeronia sp. BR00000012568055]